MSVRLTHRFEEALEFAVETHRVDVRKGSEVPYVAHLFGVCSLVLEEGGSEDQAIAALLHDTAEDHGGKRMLEQIRARFGDDVCALVGALRFGQQVRLGAQTFRTRPPTGVSQEMPGRATSHVAAVAFGLVPWHGFARTQRARLTLLCAGAGALLAGAPVAASAHVEGAQVVAIVNHQRAANGIPPIPTVQQSFASAWCPNEDAPLVPGETGRASASTDNWSDTETPYSTAPFHQQILYAPGTMLAGDVFRAGHDCFGAGVSLSELAGLLTSTPTEAFYAFVNERGPLHAVSSELADELPTTPQQEVGFPLAHRTGPQIILWAEGLGGVPVALSPTLTTAAGAAVPDVQLAAGAQDVVLVAPPLKPGTHYVLRVEWEAQSFVVTPEGSPVLTTSAPVTQTVDFATQPAPRQPARHRRKRHRA